MPKTSIKHKKQASALDIPTTGSRAIEKHLSWIPLKGSAQSVFLMIAKDSRNWEDGSIKKITMTNREIANQFHYNPRTIQRCTQLLLANGYIEKDVNKKNVSGNVITNGNNFLVPDYVFYIASLHKLSASINSLQKAGYDASDKRSQFAEIAWYLRSLGKKHHIFRAPAKMPPAHDKKPSPHDRGVIVNSTRAAAKTRSADIPRSHSRKTEPEPELNPKPDSPPKSLVSEVFTKLESISVFKRFATAHNQAPESSSSIQSFCRNIARLNVNEDVDKYIDQIDKTLSLIEKYETLKIPRTCGKPHSLARLMFSEELEKTLENTASHLMDRLTKKGGLYHELDVNRIAKTRDLSPRGVRELIDFHEGSKEPQHTVKPKPDEKIVPRKPLSKPTTIGEYDLALQEYFKQVGEERLDLYFSDDRPYLNNLIEFQNFYEIHCTTEEPI